MSRVINTAPPGTVRNQQRRVVAEALRALSQKSRFDDEAKDLTVVIVIALQEISDTIDRTIDAWERRDYYMKAERFREKWRWLDAMTDELSGIAYRADWDQLPLALARLMPHFSDITIKRMTHDSSQWKGAYQAFMRAE